MISQAAPGWRPAPGTKRSPGASAALRRFGGVIRLRPGDFHSRHEDMFILRSTVTGPWTSPEDLTPIATW